jgi:GTPase SAR1 family protein
MDFQIRVALVGYVSVGKSTVINALLSDKYSEVNMRRTTAGVNFFCISQKTSTTAEPVPVTSTAETTTTSSKSAEETHAEISKDNETL